MIEGPAVFSPTGRIDGTNASGVERALVALMDSTGPDLVFNLASVDYLSSAGLRVVLVAAKKARAAGGRTVLCGATPAVHEVLKMSGFDRILEIAPTLDEARARLL